MRIGGPYEGLGIPVALVQIVEHGFFQHSNGSVTASTHTALGDLCEESLYQIEPASARRREVNVIALVSHQPTSNLGDLVCAVVVHHGPPWVSESPLVQSALGPHHGPGAHHRDGNRIVPFPAHDGKEEETLNRENTSLKAHQQDGVAHPAEAARRGFREQIPERCSRARVRYAAPKTGAPLRTARRSGGSKMRRAAPAGWA